VNYRISKVKRDEARQQKTMNNVRDLGEGTHRFDKQEDVKAILF
jgi:hypothetical protein